MGGGAGQGSGSIHDFTYSDGDDRRLLATRGDGRRQPGSPWSMAKVEAPAEREHGV